MMVALSKASLACFSLPLLPLLLLLSIATSLPGVGCIWPNPASMIAGKDGTYLKVSPNIGFKFDSATDESKVPQDLKDALERTKAAITSKKGGALLPLVVDRGKSIKSAVEKEKKTLENVVIYIGDCGPSAGNVRRAPKGSSKSGGHKDFDLDPRSIFYQSVQTLSTQVSSDKISEAFRISEITTKDQDGKVKISSRDAESYYLEIPDAGSTAVIKAYTSLGVFRALSTLEQLVWGLPGSDVRFIQHLPIKISDRPAFPYRGFMLDTSRNYIPVSSIKRVLDSMSFAKLNQFHWHITDSQSWPLKFSAGQGSADEFDLASLSQNGAYDEDKVYDEEQVKELIQYAGKRGINVNLEVDMPAHMFMGVQDLAGGKMIACGDRDDWTKFAAEPPSGQLNLITKDESVKAQIYKFASQVLKKVSTLTPSPYLSSGGDEPNLNCYGAKKEDEIDASLIKPFVNNVQETLKSVGKSNWVWEEMAISFPQTGANLAKGTIVESWTNSQNAKKILDSNPDTFIVHAPSDYFYLDCGNGAWLGSFPNGQSWCPFVTWSKSYTFDPYVNLTSSTPSATGTTTITPLSSTDPEIKKRVLGGESALWTEQVDANNLEPKMWPRAASASEVFWTGQEFQRDGKVQPRKLDNDVNARFDEFRFRLVSKGVNASPNWPLWCSLRIGRCNLV
ncbi:hypothetical protein IE53DRAFT_337798 [Violaceomyces palustris]|uniref:Uncharacterized protein n=1 Tax=Violaceomyces palustris TaxID=1673888 RepID=A0ACD0P7D7_9BASI|nr:hypothetical protein IE53DRAFT_337798 [Violaceomyces palustris]